MKVRFQSVFDADRGKFLSDETRAMPGGSPSVPERMRPPAAAAAMPTQGPVKPRMLVTIALDNKMARSIWAIMTKNGNYRDSGLLTA
jgi:hypothetical protein